MASVGSPTVRISRRVLDRYLLDDEVPVVATRQHWVRLVEPFGSCLLGLILAAALSETTADQLGRGASVFWYLWLMLLGRAVFRLAEWSNEWFIATDRRLLMIYGLVVHKVAMMPLRKVTDMNYGRTITGRLLGYGQFVLESAGQDQAMREIRWVPDPDEKYRRICATIFGEEGHDPDDGHRTSPARAFQENVHVDPFETNPHDEGPAWGDVFDPDMTRVDPTGEASRSRDWEPVDRDDLPEDWEWVDEEEPGTRPSRRPSHLRLVDREDRDPTGPLPPRRR